MQGTDLSSTLHTYRVILLGMIRIFFTLQWRLIPIFLRTLVMITKGLCYRIWTPVTRDIPFEDTHPRLRLDIYSNACEKDLPVLVFIHGGGFENHNKNTHALVGRSFSENKFVAVLINYRLYPEVTYPVFVEDTVAALLWVRGNIFRYGGDPSQITICGHSAGAVITSLLIHDGARYNLPADLLSSAVSISGLYNYHHLLCFTSHWISLMGGQECNEGPAQPITLAGRKLSIPYLIVHGVRDRVTSYDDAKVFYESVSASNTNIEFYNCPDMDHNETLFALTVPDSDLSQHIADFLKDHTNTSTR